MMLIIGNVGGGMLDVRCAMWDVGCWIDGKIGLGLKMKFGHG